MTCMMGIDIGTYESKGVLVDTTGAILAQASRAHGLQVPRAGWAEHDAEADWWGDVAAIARALLAQSGVDPATIRGVACSAIGPCMLPVDAEGRPLMNGILYGVDTRATAEVDELTASIGADVIHARCGNALTSQAVGPKILWLKRNHPGLFARTAMVAGATSYVVWKLTGQWTIDHYTAANFAPIYDVGTLDWTDALADIIPRDRLPRLGWTTDIAGGVTPEAAAATGLAVGTPVTIGTIDAAAEAISTGVRAPGEMMVMYGSTVFVIQVTAARVADPRLFYAPWLFPGQHASMGGLATSGTLTHWFHDNLAREVSGFGPLVAEAEASPKGANGLLCLPYFSGERTPLYDPQARGAFFGLNLTHTRGDMFRAGLEGIASATAQIIDCYAEAGAVPRLVTAVGGGTKNAVWLQATSDLCGLTQVVPEKTMGASYGDAFLAGLATGAVLEDEIAVWNPVDHTIRPEVVPAYTRQTPLWRALYAATRDIAHAL